jgi:hypothetical protein
MQAVGIFVYTCEQKPTFWSSKYNFKCVFIILVLLCIYTLFYYIGVIG